MTDACLNSDSRIRAHARLVASATQGQEFDLLVIGGGVTGAGIALDAASRGLSVAIVEAQDWSSGTSSRSSKLVHGGLRYLQMLDFPLVFEALKERGLLLDVLAPHLVRPLAFLYPLRHRMWERAFVGAGIFLYDLLARARRGARALPFHRHLSRTALSAVFPDLARGAAVGAIEYWDAVVDDSRFVITLMRTAAAHGACAASRTQVTGLTKNEAGAVNGAVVMDLETGSSFPVKAKTVVSSTGVWTEDVQSLAQEDGGLRVLTSKGIHIVVPRDRITGSAALILQTATSVLFVVPWSRYWVIGTTDTPWSGDLAAPVADATDIDYVLGEANKVLARPLSRGDVIGTWAGLRPLLQSGSQSGTQSAKMSREHTVALVTPGLISIAGGKLTTYRVMAKDAVDFALGAAAKNNPCVTERIPLIGAEGSLDIRDELRSEIQAFPWSEAMIDHLLHRYGAQISDIVTIAQRRPDLAVPLKHAPAYLRAEIVYAITHEGAAHLDDLMMRRTRMVYEYPNEAMDALPEVVALAQETLGWSDTQTERESKLYHEQTVSMVNLSASA
ncbi:MAG: FAD-dependent oxidoreductase [Rhodoglobus sp.]